ncbi:GNAT family N-acetyltransferase [Piscinibacter gummiphilus]|uniref:GNAT family N-acetyltransferase n=1 Tax=Piscinibacter gummiphilus TaxID=946333 RepID=A0ABZ0D5S1_9BURK|nr:GNAT family N-acetyltransferase [Piscinibacter gummiphilus]WOB10019.1 GNAT family N-acetyltransferase [Piscinibacter gummiphilus]
MPTSPKPSLKPSLKQLKGAIDSLKRTGSTLKKLKPTVASPATLKKRHAARRQVSGLHFALADRIDALNPLHWDALAAQTVFLSRDYLRVLEAHAPSNVQPRYVLALDEGRPVAAMLFQRVSVSGDSLRKPSSKRLVDKPLAGLQEHLLVCGNLLVWGARSVAFAADVDEAQLWHGVGEAMYRLRRADKLLGESDVVMVKDFLADREPTRESLRLLGYRSVETEPDMVLTLQPGWKSYDDYLANLTSSYRSSAKKLLKDCAAAGITLRLATLDEMLARQAELHDLYKQVHQAQGLRLASLTPGYLGAMAQALGERFVCRVAERDGKWLGFVTSVNDGDTALGYYIGYDRTANADAPIYLALLQSTVEDAISFGARRLSLGRAALEPKAKMGCKPEPLACAVRHRVSALNWIVSALTRTASHDEPPERSPFKATA